MQFKVPKESRIFSQPWSIYTTAMDRACRCIRRGDAKGAAYWMTLADRSHRIDFRWHAQQLRREAAEEARDRRRR